MLGRLVAFGAAGVAAAYVAVKLGPGLSRAAEPAVRSAIKVQIKTLQKARETAAQLMEIAEDAYAEAWADLNRDAAQKEADAAESESAGVKTDGRDAA